MMRILRFLPSLALFQCCLISGFAQRIEAKIIRREIIEQRLTQISGKNLERKARLHQLFTEAGSTEAQLAEESVQGLKLPNLVCTLPGSTDSTIIVGGHYDANFDYGQGIVDNWSGVCLLPSLFESLRTFPRKHTFIFVGFAGEERGLVGSKNFVRRLSKERKASIDAMVNLECLGMTSTKVELGRTGKRLGGLLYAVAQNMKLPLSVVDVSRVGISDANAFADSKIPAITIHSVTQETLPVLHGGKDRLEAVRTDEYYEAYRLVAFYLAALDFLLPEKTNP